MGVNTELEDEFIAPEISTTEQFTEFVKSQVNSLTDLHKETLSKAESFKVSLLNQIKELQKTIRKTEFNLTSAKQDNQQLAKEKKKVEGDYDKSTEQWIAKEKRFQTDIACFKEEIKNWK